MYIGESRESCKKLYEVVGSRGKSYEVVRVSEL
jgi:hypothetical protein